MSQIPAPLLSRQVGGAVVVLSVLASVSLLAAFGFGYVALVVGLALAVIQQVFLASAVLLIGRTGLAGRHATFSVFATIGAAAILVLDVLVEIVGLVLVIVGTSPRFDVVAAIATVLSMLTALMLVLFGSAVIRASIVRPAARALPLAAGLGVFAAAIVAGLYPGDAVQVASALAVLLTGGIGLALFTPRALQ